MLQTPNNEENWEAVPQRKDSKGREIHINSEKTSSSVDIASRGQTTSVAWRDTRLEGVGFGAQQFLVEQN